MWLHLISRSRRLRRLAVCVSLLAAMLTGSPRSQAASAPPPAKQTPAAADEPAAVNLYRLSLSADSRYAYTGHKFVTTWREDGLVLDWAMLFQHMPPALDSTTYTAPGSVRGRVILEHRRSRQLWTYIPQRNVVVHSIQPNSVVPKTALPAALAALLKNYVLTVAAQPVVAAGRKAYVVTLRSKRRNRPYSQLWIDPYTGIVLRRENYRSDASLASVTYFSELKLAPTLSIALFSPHQWAARRPRQVEAHAPGDLVEVGTDLQHLPLDLTGKAAFPKHIDGYFLQSSSLLHVKAQTALHLLYTDGMDQISVYESIGPYSSDGRSQKSKIIKLNALLTARVQHAYSYTVLTWISDGIEYSAVADLSVETLQHFAAALLQTRTG